MTNSNSGAGANTSTTANIYQNQARGEGAEGIGGDVEMMKETWKKFLLLCF